VSAAARARVAGSFEQDHSEDSCRQAVRQEIPLAEVVADTAAQMRVAGIDPAIMTEYAKAMQEGATFPPIIVYHYGAAYHVADGFHRVAAARQAKLGDILAEIREGTARDAVLAAAGANATHGIRRTNADKRHAIERLLADPEWCRWSDREIGRACCVDHKSVARWRRDLTGEIPGERSVTYRDRHGNMAQMKVTGEIPGDRPNLASKLLAKIPTEDLIAELQRRGLEVRDA
jgi:ParB-like nuclease domain